MTKEIIAVVRLNAGESGYYDELSRIHLTQTNPQRDIFAGTNCTQLRRSVKSGRLRLLSGSLGEEKKLDLGKKGNRFAGTPVAVEPVFAPVVEAPIEVVAPVVEAPVMEAPVAPVVEAPVEESGIVEIAPVQSEVTEAAEVAEEVTEEGAEKKSRKKNR